MNVLGFIYLFFMNCFLYLFSEQYAIPLLPDGFSYDNLHGYDEIGYAVLDICDVLNVWDKIYNIFAWINVFIDVDFLFNLFFLTSLYYGLKFSIKLSKYVISLFK